MASPQPQYIIQLPNGASAENIQFQYGTQPLIPTPAQARPNIRLPKLHMGFGISFIVFGSLLFILEVIGIAVIEPYNGRTYGGMSTYSYYNYIKVTLYGTGIWSGTLIIMTGLLQYFAGKRKSRCCLIAAIVMDIITCLVVVSGISLASIETSMFKSRRYESVSGYISAAQFNTAKGAFVILGNCVVAIMTIVHSGFVCYETRCSGCYHKPTTQSNTVVCVVPLPAGPTSGLAVVNSQLQDQHMQLGGENVAVDMDTPPGYSEVATKS